MPATLAQLLARPELGLRLLAPVDGRRAGRPHPVGAQLRARRTRRRSSAPGQVLLVTEHAGRRRSVRRPAGRARHRGPRLRHGGGARRNAGRAGRGLRAARTPAVRGAVPHALHRGRAVRRRPGRRRRLRPQHLGAPRIPGHLAGRAATGCAGRRARGAGAADRAAGRAGRCRRDAVDACSPPGALDAPARARAGRRAAEPLLRGRRRAAGTAADGAASVRPADPGRRGPAARACSPSGPTVLDPPPSRWSPGWWRSPGSRSSRAGRRMRRAARLRTAVWRALLAGDDAPSPQAIAEPVLGALSGGPVRVAVLTGPRSRPRRTGWRRTSDGFFARDGAGPARASWRTTAVRAPPSPNSAARFDLRGGVSRASLVGRPRAARSRRPLTARDRTAADDPVRLVRRRVRRRDARPPRHAGRARGRRRRPRAARRRRPDAARASCAPGSTATACTTWPPANSGCTGTPCVRGSRTPSACSAATSAASPRAPTSTRRCGWRAERWRAERWRAGASGLPVLRGRLPDLR